MPARIEIVSGNNQTATVTAALSENLVVRVLDSRDRPVVDQRVDFSAAAGSGSLSPPSPSTDANGLASAQWVLGPGIGPQTATARVVGNGAAANLVVTFTASGTASRAARMVKFAGDDQTATAGTAVPVAPAVQVFDANDNPVAGVPVTFAVASGGGTVAPGTPVSTNGNGVAAADAWTLGPAAGRNSLTATAGGSGVSGSPATFEATGAVGSANRLVFAVQPVNAAVGAPITPPVVVQIQDASGNVITGSAALVTITLANNPTGATLSGQMSVNAVQGVATFANLRVSAPGTGYTLRALASGLTDATSTAFNVVNGSSRTVITNISPSSTVVGQPYTVAFNVTPAPPASGTPTGLVTVTDGAGASCQASVAAGGCTLVSTSRGTKQIVATYAGDASFGGSASAPQNHGVNPAATSISITAHTPNPSLLGQEVTVRFAVSVNPPGAGTPDGTVTVTYQNGGTCTAPVSAGQCLLLPTGTGNDRNLTAQYTSTSGNFGGSNTSEDHTVIAVGTTTSVVSSDPSSDVGQPVSFTATVTPAAGGGTPSGTIQFRIDDSNFGPPVPLSGGRATSNSTSALAPGNHQIRAVYNAAVGFEDSEGVTTQTVGPASTQTAAGTNPSSSVFGQSVIITAAVSSGLGTVNAGTVSFYDGGGSCGSGALLGSDAVSNGDASVTVTSLAAGADPHRIWACYSGTGTFAASADDHQHQVSRAGTTTSVSTTPESSAVLEAVTVNVSVAAVAPGSGTPSGVVVVNADDGTSCSAAIVLATGSGSCTLTFSTPGPKLVNATYQGDDSFTGSSGSTDHTVRTEQ
ncbi:MAG TPA: Ig-like domain repeat protein [Gemmatimonadales bacterium]|nr:Ig-like domain repeat protein [Gemmatimonadales bacterium]